MAANSASERLRAALAADVLGALTSARSFTDALQGCCEALVNQVGAAFARVWTLNEFDRVLELQASAGLYTHLDGAHSRVPVGQFKIGLIAEERLPHLTNDVAHDPRVSDHAWAEAEAMVSFAGYPLLVEGRTVGVVALFARFALSDETVEALAAIADAIAVGIDRERTSEDRERLLDQLDSQRALMEAVIEQMPSGMIVAQAPSGRFVLANRQVERIFGRPFADVGEASEVGEYAGYRGDGHRYTADEWPLARTIRTGEVVDSEEIEYHLGDGTWVTVETSAAPVRDAGGRIVAGVVSFHDVTDSRRANRRLAAQYAATRVLSDAVSGLGEAAAPLLQAVCEALDWDAGGIWELDHEAGRLRAVDTWHRPGLGDQLDRASRTATFAWGEGIPGRVWAAGAPVALGDVDHDPTLVRAPAAGSDGLHGAVGVPIAVSGRVLGVLELFRSRAEVLDDDLVEVLAAIAQQLGQYVERTRAELAVRSGEAGKVAMFEASLDCIVSMDRRGLVTDFNPAAETAFGWRRDEIVGHAMAERLIPPELRQGHHDGLARYLATGEGLVLGRRVELTAQRRDGSRFPIELAVARIAGDGPPSFTAFIRDITERQQAAQALYDSREQFATLAHTLQTSLLPPELPDIPGMDLAARYHPAVAGVEVGGDFYDVFRTGRASWGVVMGDVCGKGAPAAALTGLVRYTIRAAAMVTTQPARILSMVNEAILRQQSGIGERFATVAYVSVIRRAGQTTLTVACGGHPPPLVLRADGAVVPVGAPGSLLGILGEVDLTERSVRLEPGDSVTLYTDGLTEAPGPGGEFGADRLRALVAGCAGLSAEATAGRLEEVLLAHQGGTSRDDLAILVVRQQGRRPLSTTRRRAVSQGAGGQFRSPQASEE